jgi:hypothetical protein
MPSLSLAICGHGHNLLAKQASQVTRANRMRSSTTGAQASGLNGHARWAVWMGTDRSFSYSSATETVLKSLGC